MSPPHIATQTDAERIAAEAGKLEAEQRKVRALELRVKRLETTIRTFLGAGKLTEAQRGELVGLLAGLHPHAKGFIDPKYAGINQPEQRLVDRFRAMSANRRRMVSLLVAELAKDDEA